MKGYRNGKIHKFLCQTSFVSMSGLKHEGVVLVGCGRLHTIVCTRNHTLYSFGAGGEGQLGLAGSRSYETPQLVQELADVQVKQISCGTEHSAILTGNIDDVFYCVYTFKSNRCHCYIISYINTGT